MEEKMIMPWFKHYNNASSSLSIQKMMRELGVLGYGQYFLLLELACSKFDGSDCVIDLSLTELAQKLKIKPSRVQVILKSFQRSNLLRFSCDDFIFKIELPILMDLQGKDFKHNRKRIATVSQQATLEIDKEIDKDKDIKIKATKVAKLKFDLEKIYAEYPRKEGKKRGMDILKRVVKSEDDFNKVLTSVKNYSKIKYGTDLKYIKQFSSFMSSWEDYLKIEVEADPMEALREKYKHTEVD